MSIDDRTLQPGPAEVGWASSRAPPRLARLRSASREIGLAEIGPPKVGLAQVGPAEVGAAKVRGPLDSFH